MVMGENNGNCSIPTLFLFHFMGSLLIFYPKQIEMLDTGWWSPTYFGNNWMIHSLLFILHIFFLLFLYKILETESFDFL